MAAILQALDHLTKFLVARQHFSPKLRVLLSRGIVQLDSLYEEMWAYLVENDKEVWDGPKRKGGILKETLSLLMDCIAGKRGIELFAKTLLLLQDSFLEIIQHLERLHAENSEHKSPDFPSARAFEGFVTEMVKQIGDKDADRAISFQVFDVVFKDWERDCAFVLLDSLTFSLQQSAANGKGILSLRKSLADVGIPDNLEENFLDFFTTFQRTARNVKALQFVSSSVSLQIHCRADINDEPTLVLSFDIV